MALLPYNSIHSISTKKLSKQVKWVDHFDGTLMVVKVFEGQYVVSDNPKATDSSVSWSDRKKRGRIYKKELLSKLRYIPVYDFCMNFDRYPSCLTAARFTYYKS